MRRTRFKVDFNELVELDLVLLSKGDDRTDSDGRLIKLAVGMLVEVWDEDLGVDGQRDDLVARGRVELNQSGAAQHVKWCCRIDSRGIRNASDEDFQDD